jgi:hypothetical protein
MNGDPGKGLELLRTCAKQGVPMWLPK